MNHLFRGRYSGLASQLIRSQNNLKVFREQNCFKLLNTKQFDSIQSVSKRCFSDSISLLIISQLAPIGGIVLGRLMQKRWPHLRSMDRTAIMSWISENKLKVFSSFALITGCVRIIGNKFTEETPLTKRQRFVIFSKQDCEPISDMVFKIIYKNYKNRMLSVNHRTTKRINGIIRRLLESNKNFEELSQKNWTVYVIKEPNVANAFVLPNGQIFVYTGMIGVCDNDHQLAAILAHELSHTLLVHSKEMLSQEVLVDLMQTLVIIGLWIRLHPIKALFGTVISSIALKNSLVLRKRRLIELEADFIGLALTAKACYDVREGSAFWMKMSSMDQLKFLDILSTHPSNKFRYKLMDSYMESMTKIMECNNCPKLSPTDPRDVVLKKMSHFDRMVFNKKH